MTLCVLLRVATLSRVLPGQRMDTFFRSIHSMASPPVIENGTVPGDWTDFIGYALDALSNGHDSMVTEVEPEANLDLTYAKWVLGLEGDALNRWKPTTVATITVMPMFDLPIADGPPSSTPHLPDA